MATETVSFALLASLVGIGIVFVFLTMLSVLMVLIRELDRIGPVRAERPARSHVSPGIPRLPVWAIAGVAAYLEAERDAEQASASVWTQRAGR